MDKNTHLAKSNGGALSISANNAVCIRKIVRIVVRKSTRKVQLLVRKIKDAVFNRE